MTCNPLSEMFELPPHVTQRDVIEGGWAQQAIAICLRLVQELKSDYEKKIFERCVHNQLCTTA